MTTQRPIQILFGARIERTDRGERMPDGSETWTGGDVVSAQGERLRNASVEVSPRMAAMLGCAIGVVADMPFNLVGAGRRWRMVAALDDFCLLHEDGSIDVVEDLEA